MLKHIALIGGEKKLYKALEEASKGRGVIPVSISSGQELPPNTVAVVSTKGSVALVEAALELGARQEQILYLLGEAVGSRESFEPESARRIKDHGTRFAEALELSVDDQLSLERGALIRDIGKLKIPNEVLLKDGTLDYDEWTLLQKHTHMGADLVREIPNLKDTEEIVRRHHECYDGDGYPDRLEGEEIPLLARVVKIIDVYCAMTSPRHYREGHASHKEAIEHLRSERDKHFDPKLVDIFVKKKVGRTD